MVWVLLEVLDLLFAVEHLPALNAQDLSVRLLLNGIEPVDERSPLKRVSLYHFTVLL